MNKKLSPSGEPLDTKERKTFVVFGRENRHINGVEQIFVLPGLCLSGVTLSLSHSGKQMQCIFAIIQHRKSGGIPVFLSEMVPHLSLI